MAAPRQDRRTTTPDAFGHVGVTFPLADKTCPTVVNEQSARASMALPGAVGSTLPGFGTQHPDSTNYPACFLVNLLASPGDNTDQKVKTGWKTLPNTQLTDYGQDDQYLIPVTTTTQDVLASTAAEPSIINGQATDFAQMDAVQSKKTQHKFDPAVMASYFLTFPGMAELNIPRILAGFLVTWDVATGIGTFSETGTGGASGASENLSLSLQGRGQGSASVLGDITPQYAPHPQGPMPVLDYFFFLPNPVTRSAIRARATAIATILAGSATTVNDWPIFQVQTHTIIITGQKASVSEEATAKCAVSISTAGLSSSVAASVGSGEGQNEDVGQNVKAIVISDVIHGAITLQGSAMVIATANASASAILVAGDNWPGSSSIPTPIAKNAIGTVGTISLAATPVASWPTAGLYMMEPDVGVYKWGYSTVRARIFDFGILTQSVSLGRPQITLVDLNGLTGANFVKSSRQVTTVNFTGLTGADFVTALPQITTVDFTGLTGTTFQTGSAGLGFLMPSTGSTVYGVWFDTGTESQPTITGATVYLHVVVSPSGAGSTAAQIATSLQAALTTLGSPFTANASGAVTTITSVALVAQSAASDFNTGATITVTQTGSTNNPGLGFLLPSSSPFLSTFGVWFDTGTEAAPTLTGAVTYIHVNISPTASANAIASALASAFSGQTALWTVGASGVVTTFTSVSYAAQGNASDVDTGAVITVTNQGGNVTGNYFYIYGYQPRPTAIWFNTGNEIAPIVLGSTISVSISPTATAAQIAAAVVSAVPAQVGTIWTLTNVNGGGTLTAALFTATANQTTTNAVDVDSGAAITTTQTGQPSGV